MTVDYAPLEVLVSDVLHLSQDIHLLGSFVEDVIVISQRIYAQAEVPAFVTVVEVGRARNSLHVHLAPPAEVGIDRCQFCLNLLNNLCLLKTGGGRRVLLGLLVE